MTDQKSTIYITKGHTTTSLISKKPSQFRLVKRGQEYLLQAGFESIDGSFYGIEWRDLQTVFERGHDE